MSFIPTSRDVRATRSIIASLGFPTELVLCILDFARYWREETTYSDYHEILADGEWSLDFSSARPYLCHRYRKPDYGFEDEPPKIKEIEFTVVSHDQGWTSEDTTGTYQTSSFFEASIFRCIDPENTQGTIPGDILYEEFDDLDYAREWCSREIGWDMVPRPSQEMETHRLHCEEMKVVRCRDDRPNHIKGEEGTHAWYLQGNEVAREKSIFDGEMVSRYHVVWGCATNPRWEGNEGSGKGEGFIDSLQEGDWIVIWVRAKRRGWENHVLGVRMTLRYTI